MSSSIEVAECTAWLVAANRAIRNGLRECAQILGTAGVYSTEFVDQYLPGYASCVLACDPVQYPVIAKHLSAFVAAIFFVAAYAIVSHPHKCPRSTRFAERLTALLAVYSKTESIPDEQHGIVVSYVFVAACGHARTFVARVRIAAHMMIESFFGHVCARYGLRVAVRLVKMNRDTLCSGADTA